MATKTANVTARINPDVKEQAENVLEQLGIPVSVLIDSLYRQIILTKGIPYSITLPSIQTLDSMTSDQLDEMLETGYHQSLKGQGNDFDEAFEQIKARISKTIKS